MSSDRKTATEQLGQLDERREAAHQRIGELEQAWRDANQQRADASDVLVEAERRGVRGAERESLEQALAEAERAASQPWAERVAGARGAAGDVDRERRAFIAANLAELVEDREQAGRAVADRLNGLLESLTAEVQAWHRIEREIIALASAVAPIQPHDVSRPTTESLMREVEALLMAGGEEGPVLRNYPPAAERAAAAAVSA